MIDSIHASNFINDFGIEKKLTRLNTISRSRRSLTGRGALDLVVCLPLLHLWCLGYVHGVFSDPDISKTKRTMYRAIQDVRALESRYPGFGEVSDGLELLSNRIKNSHRSPDLYHEHIIRRYLSSINATVSAINDGYLLAFIVWLYRNSPSSKGENNYRLIELSFRQFVIRGSLERAVLGAEIFLETHQSLFPGKRREATKFINSDTLLCLKSAIFPVAERVEVFISHEIADGTIGQSLMEEIAQIWGRDFKNDCIAIIDSIADDGENYAAFPWTSSRELDVGAEDIRLLNDYVLIYEAMSHRDGSIFFPDTHVFEPMRGTVFSVGPGRSNREGARIAGLRKGDVVLLEGRHASQVRLGDKTFLIVRESDVLCVLEDELGADDSEEVGIARRRAKVA